MSQPPWPIGLGVSSELNMFFRYSAGRNAPSGVSKFSVHLGSTTKILSISNVKPEKLEINLPLPPGRFLGFASGRLLGDFLLRLLFCGSSSAFHLLPVFVFLFLFFFLAAVQ